MKRVLYVTTVSSTVNAFLLPHIKMLKSEGYSVDCAFNINKPVDNSLINLGVRVYNIPFSRNPLGIGNLRAFNELIRIQKQNKYELIHVHTPVASIYSRLLKVKYPELKVVYTVHGYHFLKNGSKLGWIIYYPIEKIMAKLTDATININNEDYKITKDKFNVKRCYLVNGVGINLDDYKKIKNDINIRSKLGLKEDDFVILMIAEINKNKNHNQIIKAMDYLKDKYKNIKVVIVGEGPLEAALKELIKSKNLEDNFIMLGYRNDINDLINASDIGVLLSYREGLPRSIMEFMACGKKVIVTNIRGCRDIVCNESVGTLVEVNDCKATAKAIEDYYLLNDKSFRVSNEINKYDINNINKELLHIYEDIYDELKYNKSISSYTAMKMGE